MSTLVVRQAADENAMLAIGAKLATAIDCGGVIFLQGQLGMGKTTLCRGLITALGHTGNVKSPTYALVEPYQLNDLQVYHFDFYRLAHAEELEYMGIRDYFSPQSLCLIEWPDKGATCLPQADIVIDISPAGLSPTGQGRQLSCRALTRLGETWLQAI